MAQLAVRRRDGGNFYRRTDAAAGKASASCAVKNSLQILQKAAAVAENTSCPNLPTLLSCFSCVSWANPFESIPSCFHEGPPASGGPTTEQPPHVGCYAGPNRKFRVPSFAFRVSERPYPRPSAISAENPDTLPAFSPNFMSDNESPAIIDL